MIKKTISRSAIFILAGVLSGCATVHDFIGQKTNLKLSEQILVCSSAAADPKTCKPGQAGGKSAWIKNKNFDVYSLSGQATKDDTQSAENELRIRYLGTPFYDGSLHLSCKSGVSPTNIAPDDNVLIDSVDLTGELKVRAVEETTAELVASMEAQGAQISGDVEANIKNKLTEIVESKTNVQYLWFFMKWTGGFDAISSSGSLNSCVDKVNEKNSNNTLASLVTGVAGLIVLNNQVDTTVASESTLLAAIRAAVPAEYQDAAAKVKGKVGASWTKNVNKVYTTKGNLSSNTQVVYPLWIQFEQR